LDTGLWEGWDPNTRGNRGVEGVGGVWTLEGEVKIVFRWATVWPGRFACAMDADPSQAGPEALATSPVPSGRAAADTHKEGPCFGWAGFDTCTGLSPFRRLVQNAPLVFLIRSAVCLSLGLGWFLCHLGSQDKQDSTLSMKLQSHPRHAKQKQNPLFYGWIPGKDIFGPCAS
jgi:hypothetical protein